MVRATTTLTDLARAGFSSLDDAAVGVELEQWLEVLEPQLGGKAREGTDVDRDEGCHRAREVGHGLPPFAFVALAMAALSPLIRSTLPRKYAA